MKKYTTKLLVTLEIETSNPKAIRTCTQRVANMTKELEFTGVGNIGKDISPSFYKVKIKSAKQVKNSVSEDGKK